ncbi:MAG: bifunctional folylpolyglutamate synthase/dihydrofolate synthase [Bacteroidales bacterium]|nr:bifunctional folylpolyglutamate synthase/dihydrofolate synthase [Bacteroidales bacterium]
MAEFNETEYQALVEDIFRRFPSVQKDGFSAGAYKPGLERMMAFEEALGHPTRQFRSIHVAGTNGKGSVSNMLASALSACGLRAGLFTSPHLLDFRERMVVATAEGNASVLIPKEYVFDFLTRWLPWITEHQLSFFEITTGLAFKWFADEKVDVAVIETGLGGRLDSTNILEKPLLTIVTSIGLDHMALLGNTLEQIAGEKAGIFKADVPALVGERLPETAPVFENKARGLCPLFFADEMSPALWSRKEEIVRAMDLQASVQVKNLRTVLSALEILRPAFPSLSDEGIVEGIVHTARNMGFHGRWERLREHPTVIADIGHNAHALRHNFAQLHARVDSGENDALIIVYGIMADKDLDAILPLMPRRATYLFATASTPRALSSADILKRFLTSENNAFPDANNRADASGNASSSDVIPPRAFDTVKEAVEKALELATPDTLIYIGGSTFVVADALPLFA